MKKLWILFLTAIIPTSAFALPVGNPWDASLLCEGFIWDGNCTDSSNPCANWCDAWSIRFGFYGDYVYNRHLRVDKHHNHSSIQRTKIHTNAAYLAFNFFDRVDLFGTLGATNINLSSNRRAFAPANTVNDCLFLETETDFSWSVGMRGTIWQCGCLGVGAEAQYFSTRPLLNFVQGENGEFQYGRTGDRIVYHAWQIGLGASYRYDIVPCTTSIVPYLAVTWSGASMDSGNLLYEDGSNSIRILDLGNDRSFGCAVGITLVGCSKASLTVEGRFLDERALHVNTQFRF